MLKIFLRKVKEKLDRGKDKGSNSYRSLKFNLCKCSGEPNKKL